MQKATPKKDFRFVFLAGLFFTALSVYAAINLPWGPDEKQANGFLVMAGTSKDVTVYSECKKVTAPTGKNVYVPTKSLSEWTQFKVGASNVGATLGPCGGVVNGVCSTPPAFCSAGTKIADNNNTIPGQNRLWKCQGSGGGSDSLQCNYVNPVASCNNNGVKDNGETGIDCGGGNCGACSAGPICGNGIQEAGESCDNGGANSNSTPGACKTDCSGTVPNPSCVPNGSYTYGACDEACGNTGVRGKYDFCGTLVDANDPCNRFTCPSSCTPTGWTQTSAPTCSSEGEQSRTLSDCTTVTQPIPQLSGVSCPTGNWTAGACNPKPGQTCGAGNGTRSYGCVGGNGYCAINTPTSEDCDLAMCAPVGGCFISGDWYWADRNLQKGQSYTSPSGFSTEKSNIDCVGMDGATCTSWLTGVYGCSYSTVDLCNANASGWGAGGVTFWCN